MREYVLVTTTDVSAEQLWAVAADVRDWPAWQPRSELTGNPWADSVPCRCVWSRLTIEEAVPPGHLTAVASRFLARARFEYRFEPCARGTRVRVAVALHGPLCFAYRRSFDRHMRRYFSVLVARLIERAREAAEPGRPPSLATDRTGQTASLANPVVTRIDVAVQNRK